MDWNFGNYKSWVKSKARLTVEEIGGKREEQEQRKADSLSTGSESHLEDGASLPSLRQRSKRAEESQTRRMETKTWKKKERRRKMERMRE